MITLDEFVEKWSGKACDFDGYYGTQCMDLMHQYVYDVLGEKDATILASSCAKLVYTNFRWNNLFDQIDNTLNGVPSKGDLIFWGTGTWGHVAIFLEGDVNSFRSFDANWPEGTYPHIQEHNYAGVLGWLRYNVTSELTELKDEIDKLEAMLRTTETLVNSWKIKFEDLEKKYALESQEKQLHIETLQKTLAESSFKMAGDTKEIVTLRNELESLRTAHRTLEDEHTNMVSKNDKKYNKLNKKYLKVSKEVIKIKLIDFILLKIRGGE